MAYEVLARKYRPTTFADVTGQQVVTDTLQRALESGRVAHAYLLCGPRGTGKTTTARIFAKALNCERGPTPEPCGACDACLSIARGSFPDVIEIDAASNTGVDSVRELREEANYAPMQGRAKVYVVDEVHQLSKAAFNALLKTLEEPPAHVHFVFATTEPHKVIDTVLSRCQVLKLSSLSVATIIARLDEIFRCEGIEAEDGVSAGIAARARGGMRDALTLADQLLALVGDAPKRADLEQLSTGADHGQLSRVVDAIRSGDRAALFAAIPAGEAAAEELCTGLLRHLRLALVLTHCGANAPFVEATDEARAELAALGKDLGPDRVEAMLEELLIARERMATLRGEARLVLELTLLSLAREETSMPLAEALERLVALEDRVANGAPVAPRPATAPHPATTPAPAAPRPTTPDRSGADRADQGRSSVELVAAERGSSPAPAAPNRAARSSASEAWTTFLAAMKEQAPALGEVLERSGELVDFSNERAVVRLDRVREADRPLVDDRRAAARCGRVFSSVLGVEIEVRLELAEETRGAGADDAFTTTVERRFGGRQE